MTESRMQNPECRILISCEAALERLLDAEPWELNPTAGTALGMHLRDCARCRRVAAQVTQDTQQLAVAMRAIPVRPRNALVRRPVMVPVLAMSAVVFAVLWPARPAEPPASRDVPPVVVQVPPPEASPSAPPSASPPDVEAPVRTPAMKPASPRAFARAVPLAPVRLDPAREESQPLSVETSGVTITPAQGTRATVMHTSNPKLLVVWLY